jgi:hypothetical protein
MADHQAEVLAAYGPSASGLGPGGAHGVEITKLLGQTPTPPSTDAGDGESDDVEQSDDP